MKTVEVSVVSFQELYDSLPEDIKEWDRGFHSKERHGQVDLLSVREELVTVYARICDYLFRDSQNERMVKPRIVFTGFSGGVGQDQAVANWAILEMDRPERDAYNWHGQNTSQWVFAGGLLFDRRDFAKWQEKNTDTRPFSVHT